jgi:hypothetical protein
LLLVVAIALGGHGLWRLVWGLESRTGRLRAPAGACEHAAASAACGLTLWTGLNWVLAFGHVLGRPAIVALEVALAAAGAAAIAFSRRRLRDIPYPFPALGGRIDRPLVVLIALVPIALWLAYASARGLVLPVVAPDANTYHFPKALLLLETHGYHRFPHPDFRVTGYPFDYELLLADVLAVDGSDRGTACVTVAFFALFLLAAAAQAERMTGADGQPCGRAGVILTILLVAATPIGLLQSGEHKNDLLAASAAALAFLFLGRWVARGERLYGVLAVACVALDVGTKPSGAFVGAVAAPLFVAGLVRSLRASSRPAGEAVLHAGVAIAAFVFLGGAVVALNLAAGAGFFGIAPSFQQDTAYGAWRNLLAFPALLLAVPYSPSPIDVYVPWRHERWWWMAYEMHTSHYGILFTPIALAMVPLVVQDLRSAARSPERTARLVTLGASLAAAVVMVPMRVSPSQEGGFNCFPRYLLYAMAAIVAYVVPRAWIALRRPGTPEGPRETAAIAAAGAFFVWSAIRIAAQDIYEPFDYVWDTFANTGENAPLPRQSGDRVAFFLDRVAAPRDRVLFDAGYDAWTYPAFGSDWKRPIAFAPDDPGPLDVPDDVRWVAVDRAYRVIWGDPTFKTMANASAHFFRGKPAPEDLRTITQLRADPRFRLVFRSFQSNQALFERRPPGELPADDPRPLVVPPVR